MKTICGLGVMMLATASVGGLLLASGATPEARLDAMSVVVDRHRVGSTAATVPTQPASGPAPTTVPAAALLSSPAPTPARAPTVTAPKKATAARTAPAPAAVRPLPPGKGGTWAVVMGVDDYGGSSDLGAGVADANEIVDALLDSGVPGRNIILLRNREATPRAILAATDWLVDNVGEDGLAVLAWAGHVRAVGSGTEALVTSDGSFVTDASIAARLRPLRARRSWFLIAGCYGGGFTELLGPGRLLTAASDDREESYENSLLGHSYVVEYVVRRGLHAREGPRVVSGSVSWAQAKIRNDHPGREPVGYVSGPVEPFVLGPDPTPTPEEARNAA